MRAKFINEKFVEDSDPIADMNIGMIHQIKLWMKSINEPFENKDQALVICAERGKIDYVKYLLNTGADVHTGDDSALQRASYKGQTDVVKVLLNAGANVHVGNDDMVLRWASGNGHIEVVKVLKDWIAKEKKIKKTKIRESLNEKFTEDSDPIQDMGIGSKELIKKWLKKYNITNYIINDDLTIDVNTHVNLNRQLNGNLPDYIQFGKIINGFFAITGCNLTSLRGCPISINKGNTAYSGDFICSGNKLKSLEYAPKKITGTFNCFNNSKQFTKEDVKKVCDVGFLIHI